MDFEYLKYYYLIFMMTVPRLLAACSVLTFFSKGLYSGIAVRNGVILALAFYIAPIVDQGFAHYEELSPVQLGFLTCKEVMLGFIVGYAVNIPFWAMSGVGHLIDNQRGATIMENINAMTSSPGSPLADFFTQTAATLFIITGGFLVFFKGILISYTAWPITSFWPKMNPALADYVISQFQWLMVIVIILGGPVIIALFLSELGLALISRFAPQLNVFILSMSVKSGVAIAFLCVYFAVAVDYFDNLILKLDEKIAYVFGLMQ